jgi:hypothetical protein
MKEHRLQNSLTTQVKKLWRQGPQRPCNIVHRPRQEISCWWPSNYLCGRILEAVWCVNKTCWRHEVKVESSSTVVGHPHTL